MASTTTTRIRAARPGTILGALLQIDVPGKPTQALGLNDRGQIVGFYERGGSSTNVDARTAVVRDSSPSRWQMWGPKRLR